MVVSSKWKILPILLHSDQDASAGQLETAFSQQYEASKSGQFSLYSLRRFMPMTLYDSYNDRKWDMEMGHFKCHIWLLDDLKICSWSRLLQTILSFPSRINHLSNWTSFEIFLSGSALLRPLVEIGFWQKSSPGYRSNDFFADSRSLPLSASSTLYRM